MTEEEKDLIKQEIIEQLRFDSALIDELTPAKALNDGDLFEIDGGRYVSWSRLCSEFRVQATLDQYRHVDRGPWQEGEMYYAGETNPYTGLIEISHVWYFGCKFRCLVTGTQEPPTWNSTDWEFEEGDPLFKVYLTGGPSKVNMRKSRFTLKLQGQKYYQDVTDSILPQDVVWTRYTEDRDGNPRTASDTIWAARRGDSGKSIDITPEDFDVGDGGPTKCAFTVTVLLRDGTEASGTYSYKR